MKILILNQKLRLGGAESMSVELANTLSVEDGFEVYFVAAPGPLNNRLDKKVIFYSIPAFSFFKIPFIIVRLREVFKKIDPDIIHAQGGAVGALGVLALGGNRKNKVTLITHHSMNFTKVPAFVAKFLFNLLFNHIIAISKKKYEMLLSLGIPSAKVSLIPNYIDVNNIRQVVLAINKDDVKKSLGISSDCKIITNIGRLVPGKGWDTFIKTVALCSSKINRKITGLIVGEGSELEKLKRLIISLQTKCEIKFIGYQDDVTKFLAISDVFLFTSEHEVLPMALLEAGAAGVPIVCSDIQGNSDIVTHGSNGFLSKNNEFEYCGFISRILQDEELSGLIKKNGQKIISENFDKKVVLKKVVTLYRKLYANNQDMEPNTISGQIIKCP